MDFVGLFLHKKAGEPLYRQLYAHLQGEIRAGRLAAGERLPGRRTAAAQLGVSVNTVDEAYQQLAAEGYIAARPRSGFVVSRLGQLVPPPATVPGPAREAGEAPPAAWRHSFASGDIDTALFPGKMWNRLLRETLAGEPQLMGRGEAMGDEALRSAIAEYLRGYRGVRCTAGQIVVGAGLEVLTGMLARLFAGETVAVEDPGYPKTARILRNEGVAVSAVGIDEEGMRPDLLAAAGAGLCYLTPSHHFPTGAVMPAGRRTALLAWAAAGGRYIIEDDYNSEFRFDGRPLPSMQGLDEAGRVVYAGTFSRSLAPGLRAAYLVLPPAVLARWQGAYGEYACTVSRPEQHTLARFMAGGHFSRSLNRMRAAYKKRRGLLLAALAAQLPAGGYRVENAHTGLFLLLRLPGQNAVTLARAARAAGLRLRAVEEYRAAPGSPPGPLADALVLGYGGLADGEVDAAVAALAGVLGA